MTRDEAQHLLEEAIYRASFDEEERQVLLQAIYDLADPECT